MPSRLRKAASCMGRLSARVTELKVAPMRPAAISSTMRSRGMSPPMLISRSWPIFSARVMRSSRVSISACRSSSGRAGAAAQANGLIAPASRTNGNSLFIITTPFSFQPTSHTQAHPSRRSRTVRNAPLNSS